VIIPAYNAARHLRRAVESVWATGYPALEVIIVDDGSSDGTGVLAGALCDESPVPCRILRHPGDVNRGVSASRNLGIEHSGSEFLTFLDSDDEFFPNRFSASISYLKTHAECDGVYGTTEMVIESEAAADQWKMSGGIFGLREPVTGEVLLQKLLRGSVWATSAITLRRSVLERTGVFDPAFVTAEDCHLWFRLAAVADIAPVELDNPIARYHRHTENSFRPSAESRLSMFRAMLRARNWLSRIEPGHPLLSLFQTELRRYSFESIRDFRNAGNSEALLALISAQMTLRGWDILCRPGHLWWAGCSLANSFRGPSHEAIL